MPTAAIRPPVTATASAVVRAAVDGMDPSSGQEQVGRHRRTLGKRVREFYAWVACQRERRDMSRNAFTTGVALVALALPAAASAETTAFAEAKKGDLRVLSSVLLTNRAVDLMGGWLNESQSCSDRAEASRQRRDLPDERKRERGLRPGNHPQAGELRGGRSEPRVPARCERDGTSRARTAPGSRAATSSSRGRAISPAESCPSPASAGCKRSAC